MYGLAQGLAQGLGGVVQGLRSAEQDNNAAADRQRRLSREDADAAYQTKLRTRQDEQFAREDRARSALEAANAEARRTFQSLTEPPTLASSGDAPTDGALGTPAPQPTVSREQATLKALGARTQYILKNLGPGAEWASAWKEEAGARDTLRTQMMDEAYAKYKTTGDASELVKGTYPWLDDGWDLKDATTATLPDGTQKVVAVRTRTNPKTGKVEEEQKELTADQVLSSFDVLRDPTNARKIEAQAAAAAAAADAEQRRKIQLERVKGEEQRLTLGVRGDDQESMLKLRLQAEERMKKLGVQGMLDAAGIRARAAAAARASGDAKNNGQGAAFKTEALADGRILVHFRNGPPVIAADEDGNPYTSAKQVDQVLAAAGQVGRSLPGMSNTAGQNVDQGRGLVQKAGTPQASTATKTAPAAKSGGKDFSNLWGDK